MSPLHIVFLRHRCENDLLDQGRTIRSNRHRRQIWLCPKIECASPGLSIGEI